jgi:dienelactone hydrolase
MTAQREGEPVAGVQAGQGRRAWRTVVAVVALVAVSIATVRLERPSDDLAIETLQVDDLPVTVWQSASGTPSGSGRVVLIAHGFAGSQQLMQPFATTLARAGWIAITFDFPGHGRHPGPMRGGLVDENESLRTLLAALERMRGFAQQRSRSAGGDGSYALVGHSMASDLVVRHAQAHPADVFATVGVSLFAPTIEASTPADSPRNLLVVHGALEPAMMATEARRVVTVVGGTGTVADTTYGRFADGTARRETAAPGVEHIAVLYSPHTLDATRRWLDAAVGREEAAAAPGFVDARGPWFALLFAGVIALAWPLSRALPRLAPADAPDEMPTMPRGPAWSRRGFAWRVLIPAVATPLLLWPFPSDWLSIVLGDYLALHFALYGALTFGAQRLAGSRWPAPAPGRRLAFAAAVVAAITWAALAVGVPIDRWVFNLQPAADRALPIAVLCVAALVWCLADEWLARDPAAPRGAYAWTKAAFVLSLVLAIALNPSRLFFLALLVPAILVLFVIHGLFSRLTFARTGYPFVAAVANAVVFGWFIAVTFPRVR